MNTPQWLDRNDYPFKSKILDLDDIGKMHYVDEGSGDPIVMVHGNPTWSYLYRHMIKGLSGNNRCIAMDHIGFGLSDKPHDWSYLPEQHAENLEALLENLDLENITLVVQDWGGPIGLSYALKHPQKIKNLVIMNTWVWPAKGDPHYEKFSGFMGGTIGQFLIRNFNFFAKVVMKKAYGDTSKLTKEIHSHYLNPLDTPAHRKGSWVFPKEIIGSNDWLEKLWSQREKIADKPSLILWGMKDIAFRENELNKWEDLLKKHTVKKLEDVGHFVQEELASEICPLIDDFINKK
ncbi:MAG: alpha/beta fold hydrolase [Calditrichaeota bacterium]|nr:MAG: alpha/beta fold hydrolase [Calditrichota bacterium]MBL1205579.1 alpha/beta fold hydrolase [Calditrichota bacterium]NOG45408.1 alpha/beta fold hydrolase [Calditrichota bacterium]